MKGLIQRICSASVHVDGEQVGQAQRGILLLLGVERNDDVDSVAKLAKKVAAYRIFPDAEGRMNLSLADINGDLLVISQFTLAADTRKGLRPGFSQAAAPEQAEALYEAFIEHMRLLGIHTETGRFGADMQVSLVNDGPVTFLLEA